MLMAMSFAARGDWTMKELETTETRCPGTRMAGAWLVAVAAVTAVACGAHGSNNGPPPSTAATADDDAVAGLLEHHGYHHHGGVTLFIAMSLETLGVPPEQREAVEKIRDRLHASMDGARQAEQALVMALADGLRSSQFDGGKVDGALARVTATAAQVDAASADALNELHAVLTPPQRAALVDKVEAHWAVWRSVNLEDAGRGDRRGDRRGVLLSALETDLALTPDQTARIDGALDDDMRRVPPLDRERVTTHLRTFAAAFAADRFDARAMSTERAADEQLVRWGAVHLAHVIEAIGAVLTADQRRELAAMLDVHATHELAARSAS
jgi:Spy/CpxP family protein refolding chaperone